MSSFEPHSHPAGCQTLLSIATGAGHELARTSENAPSKCFAKYPVGAIGDGERTEGAASTGATGIWRELDLGELVAHPAHGQDVARVLGVGFYLLAYVADLHVRCAGVPRELG